MESKLVHFKTKMERPTLDEAQDFVDGFVQLLSSGTAQMLMNEDGHFRDDLPLNPAATKLAKEWGYLVSERGVVGNVMILTGEACWD